MNYGEQRLKSGLYGEAVKELPIAIKQKERELKILKAKNFANKVGSRAGRIADKLFHAKSSKLKSRKIMRSTSRPTIVENQPVYSEDRSRFFSDTIAEDKRQLFFS